MITLEEFIDKFDDFSHWEPRKQVDFICYYLIAIASKESVAPKDIQQSFSAIYLKAYGRLPQYLSENAADSKKGKYINVKSGGYRLERKTYDEIGSIVKNEPTKVQVSQQLADLVSKVKNTNEQSFLVEAINCYRVEAYRATIVLVWVLTMDHLQSYIFGAKLDEFNTAFAKNQDKKINKIVNYDDFAEIKEFKLIEIARSAGIISNDVRKILDEKLGIRNSAAHPSSIVFTGHKTTEFILDLINNIVLRY